MGTIATAIKVTADTRSAVSGLKPLQTSLDNVTRDATEAESALSDLDKQYTIKLNDAAIDTAQKEITTLRGQLRDQLSLGVNADTSEIKLLQSRIRSLQSSVRTLDAETIDITGSINIDDSELTGFNDTMAETEGSGLAAAGAIGGIAGSLGGLARSVPIIGGIAAGLGGIAFGVGKVVAGSIGLADNMEQAHIAFENFLGSGVKADQFLAELQEFSAKTPFEFPELVDAGKKLLAFGTDAEDVIGIMTTLGDAAALTGADVGDLTTIWGQMQAKGKVSNEELLQLTEAGVPAFDALADSMGKTVPQIQKMASEGKLMSDDVLPLLKKGLDETFGGGMAKQAETLSGKWSTLKDTLGAIGTDLGEALIPFAEALVDRVQPALDNLADWVENHKGDVATSITSGLAGVMDFGAGVVDIFADIVGAIGIVTESMGDLLFNTGLALNVLGELSPKIPDNLGDPLIKAGGNVREFGTDVKGLGDDLHNTADNIRGAAGEVRQFGREVSRGFEKKELDLDVAESQDKVKRLTGRLKHLHTLKPTPKVKLEIKEVERKLARAERLLDKAEERRIEFQTGVDFTAGQRKLLAITQEKRVPLKLGVVAPEADDVDKRVDGIAKKKRTATIDTKLRGDEAVESRLNGMTADRYARIIVTTVSGGGSGGGGGSAPAAGGLSVGPQLADSSTVAGLRTVARSAPLIAIPGSGGAIRPTPLQREVTRVSPRQVPIQVLLDGEEISSHLELRRELAAVESVRRTA